MSQSETIGALAGALAKAQGSLGAAIKDSKNGHLGNKYADLASVWNAARDPLAANELAVIQTTSSSETGTQYLTTTLAHSSGEWISGQLKIGTEGANKGVNANQALGSSISYMRRYALAAIVGIIQEDDDGNSSEDKNPTKESKSDKWKETQDSNDLISAIKKGEKLLEIGVQERDNSRKKHLGHVLLSKSSVPQLSVFLDHVRAKYRAKQTSLVAKSIDGEVGDEN
jgi:hypothetical protein|tara:strand:+ start:631 stop:1311 length:681 start_codon:yes stop_codon:yes gene_type:complete